MKILCLLLALTTALGAVETEKSARFLVRTWKADEGLAGGIVRSLGQTQDGYLWIATAEGLERFDGLEFTTIPASGDWQGRPLDFFRVFTPGHGEVWLSTNRHGLFRLQGDSLVCEIEDYEHGDSGRITRLFHHQENTYFVRREQLWHWDGETARMVEQPSSQLKASNDKDRLQSLARGRADNTLPPTQLTTRRGDLWSVNQGALQFQNASGQHRGEVDEFDNNLLARDFLEDLEGNLWIASRSQGLVRVRPQRVTALTTAEGPYQKAVVSALRTRAGEWWLGLAEGSVERIQDGRIIPQPLITSGSERVVVSMLEDSQGRLWFASRNASVFQWDESLNDFEAVFRRVPGMGKIHALAEESAGNIWLAGRRNLFRWDGDSVVNLGPDLPGEEGDIFTLTADKEGGLFLGTRDGRLFHYDGKKFHLLATVGEVPNPQISSILVYSPREVWFTTIRSGLYVWKNGHTHHFGRASGLPDKRLTGLRLQGEDAFWLGSLGGILRVSRSALLESMPPHRPRPVWLRFDRDDGMLTRECTGGGQPAVFDLPDGSIWFTTTAGLAQVQPETLVFNRTPPHVHFSPVMVNGVPQPIPGAHPLQAGPGRSSLGFRFTGVSLSAPEEVSYRVRLAGLEPHPQLLGPQREVTYAAVPPGRYRLEVTAINADGSALPRPAVLSVEVRPHFWETGWFVTLSASLLALFVLAVGWLLARRRHKRRLAIIQLERALEDERSRISRDLHDDLGASLTELSILSDLAKREKVLPSGPRPLEQLSIKAKRAVGTLDEIVWATNPSQDSLRSLVEYLAFFAREFLKVVAIPLQTHIPQTIPEATIGPRRRHNILLTAREAINNAVKHGNATKVTLTISFADQNLHIHIADDGKGFEGGQASLGDGLKNMRTRMTDCGGQLHLESEPGCGTTVAITLPLPSES
ncbi:sensor histidine kinase [Roseibacillus ishigakijimensis]|uniref:ATP-binding protein n=1 Tax=Roseibacillus ishigakijimensis TaxID=454146 RepID=A0A934VM01_9BACT|nr:sensor histidine kinase [Roseibacillus ishigakijimensis]MBK1835219.1 ATP-binding protein [Roseibacillus ishigakijimensis]